MFYSQHLLSKKGPLGSVWVAAHCFKKLKKEQVKQTDIVSSVDMILKGEAGVVTYRILGFLLLGVVRIYSKKVKFLFHDCRGMLDELQNFMANKIVNKSITPIRRSYHSIILPERFELDAFDLEILEDQDVSRIDDRSHEDVTLADASRMGIYCENDKYYGQEDISLYGASSSANTPVRDVRSPWLSDINLDITSPYDISSSKASMTKLVGTCFSLEKCPGPKMLGDVEKESGIDMPSNEGCQTVGEKVKHHDVEINHHERARVEKSIDRETVGPMTLGDAEKETGFDVLLDEGQTDGRFPDLEINSQEPPRMEKSIDNESVEPMVLGDAEGVPGLDLPSNKKHPNDGEQVKHADVEINCPEPATLEESSDNEWSMEKLREFGPSMEDHLQPVILGEIEKESPSAMPSTEGHQMVGEQMKHSNKRINFEEPEETRLPGNWIHDRSSLSISVDVTPDFKITSGSGAGSPEFIAVPTPAPKESARALKKRKCLFDGKVIFSNKVIEDWIDDSRDLVCKRRKAPATALQAWKVQKLYTLPRSFLEPLIPCKGVDFKSLASPEKSTARVSVETAEAPVDPVLVAQMSAKTAETPVTVESPVRQMSVKTAQTPVSPVLVESPVAQISNEQSPIAPATPVTCSTSLRPHEVHEFSRPDMLELASSFDSTEKQRTLNEVQESDIGLMDEEVNSSVGHNPEKCEWSARTRRVARFLHQNISNLTEEKGDGVVNLSQVLERKTRTLGARVFYEILVLKTEGYINVRQEDAYGDILVQETSKLKQAIDADGKKSQA